VRASLEPPKAGDAPPARPIGMIVGATGMDPRQFQDITGGTINFAEIKAGGGRARDVGRESGEEAEERT
jgi:hypothetical protein